MNPRFQIIGSSNEVEVTSGRISHAVGRKRYELTNHLGNVLTVISDRRIAADNVGYEASPTGTYSPALGTPGLYHAFISGTTTYIQTTGADGIIDYYTAEIISSSEYSAFGVQLQDWGYQSEDYRYAFQGQEVDNELWAGAVSYKYRMEDPRLGRFFSVDPLAAKYPHNSVYAFSENMVIHMVELEGLESTVPEQLKTNPEVEEPTEITDPVPDPDWLNVDQVPFNPPLNFEFERTLYNRFEPSFSIDLMPKIQDQVNKVFKSPELVDMPVNKVVRDLSDQISGLDYTVLQDTEGEYSNTATLTQLQVTVTKTTVTDNSGPYSVNETYPEDHEDPMRQFYITAPPNGSEINITTGKETEWKIQISMKIMVQPPNM